jgi:LacI family transcriptional regulator
MGAADGHDLLVTLGSTVRRPDRELEYLRVLRGQRSRAVVLAGSRVDDDNLLAELREHGEAFERAGGRVVVISQNRLPFDTIVIENRSGAKALATALAARGYEHFAVLGGPTKLLTARDRVQGFRDGISRAGLPAPLVVHGDFTRDGGHDAMAEVLDTGTQVDCTFAVNDVMAVGAMAACRSRGLRLPGDMALAGFDDIATLRDVDPGLTTVRLPLEEIGAMALELVVSAEGATGPRTRRVKGEVLIRESTPER